MAHVMNANTTPMQALNFSENPAKSMFVYRGWSAFTNHYGKRRDYDSTNSPTGLGNEFHFRLLKDADMMGQHEIRYTWDSCTVTGGTNARVHDYFGYAATEYIEYRYQGGLQLRFYGAKMHIEHVQEKLADERFDLDELVFGNKTAAERAVPLDGSTPFECIVRFDSPWSTRMDKKFPIKGLSHPIDVTVRVRPERECIQADTDPTSFAYSNLKVQLRSYNIHLTSTERAALLADLDSQSGIIYYYKRTQVQRFSGITLAASTATTPEVGLVYQAGDAAQCCDSGLG